MRYIYLCLRRVAIEPGQQMPFTICFTNLNTSLENSKIFLIAEQLITGKGCLRRRLESKFHSLLLLN